MTAREPLELQAHFENFLVSFTCIIAKEILKDHLEKTGDTDAAADWAARKWLAQTAFKFISYEVMYSICRQMVRNAVEEDLADDKEDSRIIGCSFGLYLAMERP